MSFNRYAHIKIDKTKRKVLVKELSVLNKEEISAGIHKEQGKQEVSKSGFKLIDVAVQNNFGNSFVMPRTVRFKKKGKWFVISKGHQINIPETRFIGKIIQEQGERTFLMDVVKSEIHLVIKQYINAKDAVREIGKFMRDRIRGYISNKEFTPNAPMTVEAKGFDKRLFDKGLLYNAIRYKSRKTKQNG